MGLSSFFDELKPALSTARSEAGRAATKEARAAMRKSGADWARRHKKGLMVGGGIAGAYGLFNVSPINREARYNSGRMKSRASSGATGTVPANSSGGYTYGG